MLYIKTTGTLLHIDSENRPALMYSATFEYRKETGSYTSNKNFG